MKQNRHHFFLGVFVLSGIGLIGTAVTLLGAKALWEDYIIMETYIDESVSGLERGSPVKFRGITVGKVEEITTVSRVYSTTKSYAYIQFKIYRDSIPAPSVGGSLGADVRHRVEGGLRVFLASTGITGGNYIETEYVTNPKSIPQLKIDWTPSSIYIPSVPSTLIRFKDSLTAVLDNLAKTDLRGVVVATRDTLRQVEKSMASMDLAGLSDRAQKFLDKTGSAAEAVSRDLEKLTAEINKTLQETRGSIGKTFETADATLRNVNRLLEKGEVEKSLTSLARFVTDAQLAVQDIRALTQRADHTVAGVGQIVRGRSRELSVAVENLREILGNINSLTGTLKEFPSLLFVGNAPPGAQSKGGGR